MTLNLNVSLNNSYVFKISLYKTKYVTVQKLDILFSLVLGGKVIIMLGVDLPKGKLSRNWEAEFVLHNVDQRSIKTGNFAEIN